MLHATVRPAVQTLPQPSRLLVAAVLLEVLGAWPHGAGADDAAPADPRPPFHGTIFSFPDLMKESDPTAFTGLRFVEDGRRRMFDRRIDRMEAAGVFVFEASFADCGPVEVAVNREFETEEAAREQAEFYAAAFGRLPLFLRKQIDAMHIQAGRRAFGGGRTLLVHAGQGEAYHRPRPARVFRCARARRVLLGWGMGEVERGYQNMM